MSAQAKGGGGDGGGGDRGVDDDDDGIGKEQKTDILDSLKRHVFYLEID